MPHNWDDDDESDWDDDDYGDDSDDPGTIPCPHCRREVDEDAQRCPYCERYLSDEEAVSYRKPLWIVITAIVCLCVAIFLALV